MNAASIFSFRALRSFCFARKESAHADQDYRNLLEKGSKVFAHALVGWVVCTVSMAGLFLPNNSYAAAKPELPLPETCFLFAFFYHQTEGEGGGLHLAWSRDGLSFEMLNGGAVLLKPEVGEAKLFRDPGLMRGPDGVFRMVWTTAWAGRTIGYASSPDLIHWSKQRAIPVMANEPATQNCWAPELVWDPKKNHYLIFWSSTVLGKFSETEMSNRRPDRNHRIYATATVDFTSFTTTRLLYDGGFNVIDADMAQDGDHWLMFVKNETFAPKTEKNIRMIRADTPDGPFSAASPAITGAYWAEGPSALKVGDWWYVYFDKHMENKFGLVRSRDLEHWEDQSAKLSFPKDARHGTIMKVPRSIIAGLLALPSAAPDNPVEHSTEPGLKFEPRR